MATTTEIPTIHSVPPLVNGTEPAAEIKRPRGRPQKCKQCGENIDPTRAHVCATPPVAEEASGDEDFWITISNFTPEEWNHLTAYLYRVMPRIDRKANGKPINLGCYSTAFTRDDIMQEHGSGVYRIDVTQLEPASSRSRRIAREVFTIINPKYPPIVPPGDWVDDKVNDMWKWGAPPGAQSTGPAGVGYPPGFNIKDVYDSAFQMAKALTPPPAPPKDDTALTTIVGKLLDASLNKPEPKTDTSIALVIELLRADLKEAREEMREMRKNAAAPVQPKGILEQMKELKPVIAEAVDLFTQKNGGDQPWWAAPLEKLMEGVGEAIPSVVDMMKNGQQQQRQQPQGWTGPQPQVLGITGVPVPVAQTQPQPVASTGPVATAQTAPAPQPDPQANLTDEQKAYLATTQRWGGFILLVAPQMVEHFKTANGVEFRDWILRMHGLLRWTDMCRELGPDYLLAMIAQHPGISADMQPEHIRKQFVEEFFSQIEEDDEEDPDDGVITIGGNDAA